jgi:chromosome segregation ATPase
VFQRSKKTHKFFIPVTNIIQKFNETFEADKLGKVKLQSKISFLQAELESLKNKSDDNTKLIEEKNVEINEIKIQATNNSNNVDRLDKKLRVATSCSFIANMGYNESGTFFLDTDGIGKSEVPYEVSK